MPNPKQTAATKAQRYALALREIKFQLSEMLEGTDTTEIERVLEPSSDVERVYSVACIALLGGKKEARRWAEQRRRLIENAMIGALAIVPRQKAKQARPGVAAQRPFKRRKGRSIPRQAVASYAEEGVTNATPRRNTGSSRARAHRVR